MRLRFRGQMCKRVCVLFCFSLAPRRPNFLFFFLHFLFAFHAPSNPPPSSSYTHFDFTSSLPAMDMTINGDDKQTAPAEKLKLRRHVTRYGRKRWRKVLCDWAGLHRPPATLCLFVCAEATAAAGFSNALRFCFGKKT